MPIYIVNGYDFQCVWLLGSVSIVKLYFISSRCLCCVVFFVFVCFVLFFVFVLFLCLVFFLFCFNCCFVLLVFLFFFVLFLIMSISFKRTVRYINV